LMIVLKFLWLEGQVKSVIDWKYLCNVIHWILFGKHNDILLKVLTEYIKYFNVHIETI
jgi:hypothetical protein